MILKADKNLNTLIDFRYKRKFVAKRGGHGGNSNCTGPRADDVIVKVPLGTLVRDDATGVRLADLTEDGQEYVCLLYTSCTVSLPEQYAVTVVERPTDPNDELGVQVAQLSISDPVNKSMTMHVMVESSKLTKELPDLNYRPGGVMKDYFAENLQNSGWQEPVVSGELQNGKMYFIKFSSYIADSVGQKYDGQIYACLLYTSWS